MYKNLSAGAIGIRDLALPEVIELAGRTGYAGIDFDIREAAALAETHDVDYVRELFAGGGVKPGLWSLPVAWKEDRWEEDLRALPALADLGRGLGCLRTATWCPSWSDERNFDDNYAWHLSRFRPIARALANQGCRFGIEFLGPKTLRTSHKHGFIHTMNEMMRLAGDIGTGNVGLLLDAWHLYTSGDSADDLSRISDVDVVTVHVSDAPVGIAVDELEDTARCLPMETGIIDLPAFMRKLKAMGYDGPVTTEPFNARINAVAAANPEQAAREVSEAMDRLWEAGGLRT